MDNQLGDIVRASQSRKTEQILVSNSRTLTVDQRFKDLPILGAAHTADFSDLTQGGTLMSYFIRFVNTLNPNGNSSLPEWPQYTADESLLLTFKDGEEPFNYTSDTFRQEAINWLMDYGSEHPLPA